MVYNVKPSADPKDQALVDAIRDAYLRLTVQKAEAEVEIRREYERRTSDMEASLAARVLEARERPGISNRQLMVAIGKQNPARWKEYLEKWGHLEDVLVEEAENAPIIRELDFSEPWGEDADTMRQEGWRAFLMRNYAFPFRHRLSQARGRDVVVRTWENGNVRYLWANQEILHRGLGEHQEEIVEAIEAWISEEEK